MKTIPLSQGQHAIVSDEDYERVSAFNWYAALSPAGHWYAERKVRLANGKWTTLRMHRFILGLEYGDPLQVDHKDRAQTLNNTRSNLRITFDQNQQNAGLRRDSTSGFKGVNWDKRVEKWKSQITVNGKRKFLGYRLTAEVAARVYDAAAVTYYGEFAVTNVSLGLLPPLSKPVMPSGMEPAVASAA